MVAQSLPKPADYSGQLYMSATYTLDPAAGHDAAYGHINAVDPVTGKKAWEVVYKYPPMASLLSTKGGPRFRARRRRNAGRSRCQDRRKALVAQ